MRRPLVLVAVLAACGSGGGGGGGGGESQVATPTFNPGGGTYSSAQSVQIQCAAAGATIFYTTDGSSPTASSSVYSGPVSVTSSGTLSAMATASGLTASSVGTAVYVISSGTTQTAAPTFNPGGGQYASGQLVSMSSATSGAVIYFTTDGSTPTTSSAVYSGPVSVSATATLKAIAVAAGHTASTVTAATYTISGGSDGTALDFTTCPFHPIWLAYQDGGPTAAWTVAPGSNSVFRVNITSGRGGIAFAYTLSNLTTISILYQSQAAIAAGLFCGVAAQRNSVNGSLAGLGTGDIAQVALGGGNSTVASSGPFSVLQVTPGAQDLVAYRHSVTGTASEMAIIRRGVNVANGGSLGATLDFGTSEAFTPTSVTITVSGAEAGEHVFHGMNYEVGAGCQDAVLYGTVPVTGSTFTAHGIPAGQQVATDFHGLIAFAQTGTSSSRTVYRFTHTLTDSTLALPAALPAPTITTLSGSYKRLQTAFTLPADYLGGLSTNFNYVASDAHHAIAMSASPAYLGGASVTLAMPDFSGLSGWDNTWAPSTTSTGTWNTSSVSGSPSFCVEGGHSSFAAQHGTY